MHAIRGTWLPSRVAPSPKLDVAHDRASGPPRGPSNARFPARARAHQRTRHDANFLSSLQRHARRRAGYSLGALWCVVAERESVGLRDDEGVNTTPRCFELRTL